jgi:hypothetical protein
VPSQTTNEPVFCVGSQVRVRAGVKSSIFPDLPLGGWTGTVFGMDENKRLVRWSGATLSVVDPIWRHRFENGVWMPVNQLEADPGEPLAIEEFKEETHARANKEGDAGDCH